MNFDQVIKRWWMLISYGTLNKLPNFYVPWYPSLKMKKMMPACPCISWGCWQSKWVHVQCMRFLREKCWLNVKFAFVTFNVITLLFCTSSRPMEGPLLFLVGHPSILLFLPGPCRITSWECLMENVSCSVGHRESGLMVKRPKIPSPCY